MYINCLVLLHLKNIKHMFKHEIKMSYHLAAPVKDDNFTLFKHI